MCTFVAPLLTTPCRFLYRSGDLLEAKEIKPAPVIHRDPTTLREVSANSNLQAVGKKRKEPETKQEAQPPIKKEKTRKSSSSAKQVIDLDDNGAEVSRIGIREKLAELACRPSCRS